MGPQHALPNMYGRSAFPNSGILGPSQVGFGSSDFSDVSAADAYRQHHEVTAMVSLHCLFRNMTSSC